MAAVACCVECIWLRKSGNSFDGDGPSREKRYPGDEQEIQSHTQYYARIARVFGIRTMQMDTNALKEAQFARWR
jgi:hypothetical protein